MVLFVLLLLACQNCGKNLELRFVMKAECQKTNPGTAFGNFCTTILLAVPASAFNFQTRMEYVALANLHAATFSLLVQTKLCSAICSGLILRKQLTYPQGI
ncbi:hypothetical protein ACA910_007905 [Epithemia clementina (nom. ined.)]